MDKKDTSEIEKKFMVKNDQWKKNVDNSITIYQGYFTENELSQRIRIVPENKEAIVAYKKDVGLVNGFLERIEIERDVDYAEGLLKLIRCNKVLVKKRNFIKHGALLLEVDEFLNLDKPLVMVEVEVKKAQLQDAFDFPDWFGKDVTVMKKYRNYSLIKKAQNSDIYLGQLIERKKLKI